MRLAARTLPTKIQFSKKAESTSQNLLMKIERVITDVAVVESPNRAEREVFGLSLTFFGQVKPILWSRGALYDLKTHLEPQNIT